MEENKLVKPKWKREVQQLSTDQPKSLIEATGISIEELGGIWSDALLTLHGIVLNPNSSDKDKISAAKRLMDLPSDLPQEHGNTKGKVTNQTIIVNGSVFDMPKKEEGPVGPIE